MKSNFYSRMRRLNHLYKIVNKKGVQVIFKMNATQLKLFDKENEAKKKCWKIRIAVLKSRQLWMTTYKCIDKLDKCLMYSNVNANIVAHNKDKLQEIFAKVKLAYEMLPNEIELNDWKTRKKPIPKYDNKNELFFPEKNSRIKITLDSRSWTLTDLHISELAFIDKAQAMLRWTLPSAEHADITIETTANWMNFFKYFRDNNSQFGKIFFPWYLDDTYQEEAPEHFKPIKDLEYQRTELWLSDNKVYRYQKKYLDDPFGTMQEYPTRAIDAFIASWKPFYNIAKVNKYNIIKWEQDEVFDELTRYNREKNDDTLIWIDLAEWLDHWDCTVIRVRDRDFKLIASYRSNKIEPWDVVKVVNYLYNNWISGIIAPERNNHWHTFIYAAKAHSWYDDIYIPKQDKDDKEDRKNGQRWWHTNLKTRPVMLDEHKESINDRIIEMDEQLKNECYTFVIKNSKPQAEENCNDDVIMADAICLQMAKEPKRNINKDIEMPDIDYWDFLL